MRDDDLRRQLRDAIRLNGVAAVSRKTGLGQRALLRFAAGDTSRPSTLVALRLLGERGAFMRDIDTSTLENGDVQDKSARMGDAT
jgi:hypothetical protein